jgi:hypothetical protein
MCNFSFLIVFCVCHHLHPCTLAGALQLDGARPQPRVAASVAVVAITALQQQHQQQPVLEPAAVAGQLDAPSSTTAAALDAVSYLAMALSGEADAAHAAAAAAVVPVVTEPLIGNAIRWDFAHISPTRVDIPLHSSPQKRSPGLKNERCAHTRVRTRVWQDIQISSL